LAQLRMRLARCGWRLALTGGWVIVLPRTRIGAAATTAAGWRLTVLVAVPRLLALFLLT
jgi:hypothetical protein